MASLPPASVAVDLSRLPPPQVIEALSFDTIRAQMIAFLQNGGPDFAGFEGFDALVESDPAIKLIEVFAYRELLLRQNFNERAVSMLLPFAKGADLDNLAAFFGVERLVVVAATDTTAAVMETDEALLRRVLLAPDSYSVAGPESAYVYHALTAAGTLSDASATSPKPDNIRALVASVLEAHAASLELRNAMSAALANAIWPGEVVVSLLNQAGDGTATPEQIAAVDAVLTHDEVRPLTDSVTVASAEIVDYEIEAVLHIAYGPDADLVLATANASLATYLGTRRKLGRLVSASGHAGALQVAGVETLELISPAADIPISRTQAANPTSISITVAA